nr:MAG TPA: hypothetical protein [Caudoviricetes sp.]
MGQYHLIFYLYILLYEKLFMNMLKNLCAILL